MATRTMEKNKNNETQNRREFFKEAAKKALPIIGAVALMSNPMIAKAVESESLGCNGLCRNTCTQTCASNCRGGCKGRCEGGCKGRCEGSCKTGCYNTCYGNSR